MSNNNTTPVVETPIEALDQGIPVVPVAKTKKELKKERKEIKKHKKQVAKEAKLHSAKTTKLFRGLVTVVSLIVIASMIFCSVCAIKITQNVSNTTAATQEQADSNDSAASDSLSGTTDSSTPSTPVENTTSSTESTTSSSAETTTAAGENNTQSSANAASDINTKEGAVEYFKTAHAKVLAEAKSVTRVRDNPTQYNDYLNVGGNSTLEGVGKTLMGTFLKENTEAVVHTGADIAANFPPTNNSCAGLTADMIGNYNVKEEGDNYIITLSLNSSEENPDLGENSAHLVSIVESKQVEEAAAGFVSFTGLRNEYIAPTVTATINKTTGQMTAFHTIAPSYMKFDKATVAFVVNVNDVGIGLQYEQEWTIQW